MSDEALKALDEQDRVWMAEAQMLARQAGEEGEVPIGAIIVGMVKDKGRKMINSSMDYCFKYDCKLLSFSTNSR